MSERIVILGAGESGVGAAILAQTKAHEVFVSDNGKIREKGVHIPVIPDIYRPVLDQLETMGIRMVEEYGLPLTEKIA